MPPLKNGLRRAYAIAHLAATLGVLLYAAVLALSRDHGLPEGAQAVLVVVLALHGHMLGILYQRSFWPSVRAVRRALAGLDDADPTDTTHGQGGSDRQQMSRRIPPP